MEPTSRSAKGFCHGDRGVPGLPECPSISPSHRTSHRTRGRGRAASNAERCPRGMLPEVDVLSILLIMISPDVARTAGCELSDHGQLRCILPCLLPNAGYFDCSG